MVSFAGPGDQLELPLQEECLQFELLEKCLILVNDAGGSRPMS